MHLLSSVSFSVKADLPYTDSLSRTIRKWRSKAHPILKLKSKNLVELDAELNNNPNLLNFIFNEEESNEDSQDTAPVRTLFFSRIFTTDCNQQPLYEYRLNPFYTF